MTDVTETFVEDNLSLVEEVAAENVAATETVETVEQTESADIIEGGEA